MDPKIVLLATAIGSASCSQPTETGQTEAEPDHPWDWIPADKILADGREVYMAECSMCHNEGEEGAPALTRADEWKLRIEKGIPMLIDNAINGSSGDDGEMPARGGTPSLSDEEVSAAVHFMIASPKE